MPLRSFHTHMMGLTRRFLGAAEGVSAVEFALIGPVLLVLFCGSIDLSRIVTASNRATFVADGLAEIFSQVDHTVTASEITTLMMSSVLIDPDILSYQRDAAVTSDRAVNITVSSVAFQQKDPLCLLNCAYDAFVVFSQTNNTSIQSRACGKLQPAADDAQSSPSTLPSSAYGPASLVIIDIDVFIKPTFSFLYGNNVKFSRSAYFRPRLSDRVNSSFNCSGY